MTHASTLDELERDVERARARLAGNIARLRDPRTISLAKADLMAQANDYSGRLVEKVGAAASARAHGFTDALRQRAQENPAAVAAIGAGLLWRLWKHPPVVTLLLGAGLASLLAGRGEEGGAAQESLLGRVQDVNRATHAISDRAAELAERARDTVADLAEQARVVGDQTATTLSLAADRTVVTLAGLNERQGEALRENPVAMSVAAMALGAALGVVLRRRG
jgi:hypothetical protein